MKTKTKITLICVVAVVLLFAGLTIARFMNKNSEFSVEYPSDYLVLNKDNAAAYADYVDELGFEVDSFCAYLEKKNIISFAANKNNSRQFRITENETELSKEVVTLKNANDVELKHIAKLLFDGNCDSIEYFGSQPFYSLLTGVVDKNGDYVTQQYITISNAKYYSVVFYGSSKKLTAEDKKDISEVMLSLRLPNDAVKKEETNSDIDKSATVMIIVTAIAILLSAAAVLFIAYSIIRDIKKKKSSTDNNITKIKRKNK